MWISRLLRCQYVFLFLSESGIWWDDLEALGTWSYDGSFVVVALWQRTYGCGSETAIVCCSRSFLTYLPFLVILMFWNSSDQRLPSIKSILPHFFLGGFKQTFLIFFSWVKIPIFDWIIFFRMGLVSTTQLVYLYRSEVFPTIGSPSPHGIDLHRWRCESNRCRWRALMKIRWFSHVPVMLEKGTLGFLGFLGGWLVVAATSQLGTPVVSLGWVVGECWGVFVEVFLNNKANTSLHEMTSFLCRMKKRQTALKGVGVWFVMELLWITYTS